MEINTKRLNKREFLLMLVGFISLTVIVIVCNRPPLYDEVYYLMNVELLQKYGLNDKFLVNHLGSAGPLYAVVHYLLQPLTNLQTPQIRLINLSLLAGSFMFLRGILKTLSLPPSYAWLGMAVPMTYVISGLALTEIPAIFFLSAGFYLIIRGQQMTLSFPTAILHFSFAGLLLSIAILGRQPYLVVLAALPFLFLKKGDYLRSGILLLITLIFALALPLYVFSVWGGLVPPSDATLYDSLAAEGLSLQPIYFFTCIAYYAIVFLIVSPHFYIVPNKKEVIIIALLLLVSVILNFRFNVLPYLPMKYLIEKTFPSVVAMWAESFFGALFFIGSLYFMLTLLRQLIVYKFTPTLLFLAASLIVIAVSCMKITWGFSSRYPAQALPFLVLMFAWFYKDSKFNMYRLGIGVLLGLVSFASFLALN